MSSSSDSEQTPSHAGACQCGSIKYKLSAEPKFRCLCHCSNCQKLSGTAFASNAMFPRDSLEVTEGKDKLSVYENADTQSGKCTYRHFCSKCGTALYILPETAPEVVIIIGAGMDDFDNFKPNMEFFATNRRAWLKDVEGTKVFEKLAGSQ